MVKATQLGTKRQCPKCAARFYDFDADPVICVKCGAVVPVEREKSQRKRKIPAAPRPVPRKIPAIAEPDSERELAEVAPSTEALELETLEDDGVEVMSLEEVGEHEEEEEANADGDDAEDEMFIEEEMAASGIVDDIRAYIETDEKMEEEDGNDADSADGDSHPQGQGRNRG
jgi:uncharacterized protein (TIGR02300 family)